MPDLSPREQLSLLKILAGLPQPTFGEVVILSGVSSGIVPGTSAAQGTRAEALLEWAKSHADGLSELKAVVDEVIADSRWTPPPDDEDDDDGVATSADTTSASPTATQGSSVVRDQVFVSYSHKDSEWLEKLQVNLKPLIRKGAINLWDDTQILPGAKWRDEINNALARAKVAVLLVSSDFLNSDFIDEKELPQLLSAAENEGLTVIWVPVRPSLYEETAIADYQAAHSPAKPLSGLNESEQELALVKIAKVIRDALQS